MRGRKVGRFLRKGVSIYVYIIKTVRKKPMKAASIVFNVLEGAIAIFLALVFLTNYEYLAVFFVFLLNFAVCLSSIIAIKACKKKDWGYISIGILDLILGNLLAGIFMLCAKQGSFKEGKLPPNMRRCPDCRKPVGIHAETCPHCGCTMTRKIRK